MAKVLRCRWLTLSRSRPSRRSSGATLTFHAMVVAKRGWLETLDVLKRSNPFQIEFLLSNVEEFSMAATLSACVSDLVQ